MEKQSLVVDKLSIFSLIPIFFKFRTIRLVFYLYKSENIFNNVLLKILSKCGWAFELIRDNLSPVNGVSPYKEFEKLLIESMKACREKIFSKKLDALTHISEYERVRLSACFSKYAGAEIYFAMRLFSYLTTNFPHRDKVCAVLLRRTIFSDTIMDTYKSRYLTPYFYSVFSRGKLFPRENYLMDSFILNMTSFRIYSIVRPVMFIFRSFLYRCIYFSTISNKNVKKHRICALVFNANATELCNCLPWSITGIDDLKNETLSLHLPFLPKAVRDFYRSRSDRLLEYSFNPFVYNKDIEMREVWSKFISSFLKNLWTYRKLVGLTDVKRWMLKYLLDITTYLSFFDALFYVNRTKILWCMNEDDSQTQMATIAIHRLGGVSVGTTWSEIPLPMWDIQHNQHDVYFLRGKRQVNVRIDTNDQCNSFVTVGYPADKMFPSEFERAQSFRASICGKNILVFFDNMSANDILVSPDNLFEIYKEMVAWLEEDDANLLVIKAKRAYALNKHPMLKKIIDNPYKEGRILILYEKAVIYPSLAADVVIGVSLTLPSIAATLGRPFVFYDIHGVVREYPLGLPNVYVISKATEIRQAINNAMKESRRSGYSGKLQPIMGSNLDPFVDGKAAHRMREYMKNLLYKLDRGCTNYEAINFANEKHKNNWGGDTVMYGPMRPNNKKY